MSHEWQGPLRPGEKPNNEEIPPAKNQAEEKPTTSEINVIEKNIKQ